MDGSGLVLWKIFILGFFTIGCYGSHGFQKTSEGKKSLHCYVCNSYFDPRCGLVFDNYTIARVDCSQQPRPDHLPNEYMPVVCRKSIQIVEGDVRVIRNCGYIGDEEHDDKSCFIKTGTHFVHVTHCSCTEDDCNTGHISYSSSAVLIMFSTLWALFRIK